MNFKQIVLVGFLTSFLVSCDSGASTVPIVPPASPAQPTTAEKIADLETSGKLPKLDRSADIRGPDVDANGIRDDIDAFIASQNYTQPQKASLQQIARAHQLTLTINVQDPAKVDMLLLKISRGVDCVFENFPQTPYPTQASILVDTMEKITFNTKARTLALFAMSKAADGSVMSIEENPCD